ncbi:hypothetical protein TNCV_4409231 [Trichonephila clavipes]|nr:hypothetical protein TNCV_4409231 [Trichonephila clavipes]
MPIRSKIASRWFVCGSETVHVALGSLSAVWHRVRNDSMPGHNRHKRAHGVTIEEACLTQETNTLEDDGRMASRNNGGVVDKVSKCADEPTGAGAFKKDQIK